MAEAMYTAGPWFAAPHLRTAVGWLIISQSGRTITYVPYFGLGDDFKQYNDECAANARLIAAAPALLAALKAFAEKCDPAILFEPDASMAGFADILRDAIDAISAAEGRANG